MKIKRMIVISACMILLAGCAKDTREEHAGVSDAVNTEETIGTAEENTNISGEETGEKTDVSAGVEETASVSDEITEETLPEMYRCEQNDAYKLFYGTWEITQVVSEHRSDGRREGWEDILGMQVTYLPDRYEFGEIVTVDHPNYLMSIFPNGVSWMADYLRQLAVGEDTLLPDNGVFVWVQIKNIPRGVESGRSYDYEPFVGSEFFIKDANTLYCFDYECLYEMKRVSYDEVSEEVAESVPRDGHQYKQNDAYKLFYGTWEITDIVSESRYLGADEGCEDILGMQVTYLSGRYEFGGIVKALAPNYLISILPTDSRFLFDQRQVSMDTLLPDTDFFVWVQIADASAASGYDDGRSYGFEAFVGSNFIIKDDNTLYLFAYNCIYEMKRVSYVDDYDHGLYALSYRERS